MCERHGSVMAANLKSMDFSRRNFLRATAATTLTMAVGPGLMGGPAHAASTIKSTHGSGFCNLNIFLSHALQTAKDDGLELEFVNTPTFAEQVTFLGIGQVDVGLMPYTSFVALFDAGAPVKIVAGGGIEGCVIVSRPGLDTPEKLKGKTLGTFQLDTLEVMPYDWLKKHGVNFKDVKVRYMGNTPEAVEAFKAGAIDWICTIEPYGTALLNDVKGSHLLSDGTDIYGKGYTDCVLACRTDLITKNPAGLKALIKGMMKAQAIAETKPDETLTKLDRHLLQDLDGEREDRDGQAARRGRRAQPDPVHPRSHRLAGRDGLHQEEARPRRHRLDAARAGHRREQGPLRQPQVQVGVREPMTDIARAQDGRARRWRSGDPSRPPLRGAASLSRARSRASDGRCFRSGCSPGSGNCFGTGASPTPSCCRRRMSSSATSPSRPSSSTPRSAGRSALASIPAPSGEMALLITMFASAARVLAGLLIASILSITRRRC